MSDSMNFYSNIQVLEPEDQEMECQQRLRAMTRPLLSWYEENRRILPWREDPSPYHVWISEIMLQQTRVEAVKPYYFRFMEALPDIKALAQVEDDRLMKLWEGLGYYSRARNLKKAALEVMESYGGSLPASREELLKLPGIGSYTAGAIASIAFGIPAPAVDGNVLRVIARVLADRRDIRSQKMKTATEERIAEAMPQENPGDYNQALIEIGALLCIPGGEPKCSQCPLESLCLTRKQGLWKEIPLRSALKKRQIQDLTVFLIFKGEQVALRRRPSQGLLASLYELPNCPGHLDAGQAAQALGLSGDKLEQVIPLKDSKHIFSHVEWHMKGYLIRLDPQDPWPEDQDIFMVECEKARKDYSIPGAFRAYTALLESQQG